MRETLLAWVEEVSKVRIEVRRVEALTTGDGVERVVQEARSLDPRHVTSAFSLCLHHRSPFDFDHLTQTSPPYLPFKH